MVLAPEKGERWIAKNVKTAGIAIWKHSTMGKHIVAILWW